MRLSPLMIAPPLIFAGLATLFMVGMQRENPDALPLAIQGDIAPDLNLDALPGKTPIDAAALRAPGGKLVNFWASWCGPCRTEHPHLEALAAEGIPIFGINYKDDPEKALGFLEELGDPYSAVSADTAGRVALDWGLYGVPETYVLNGEGRILLRFAGPLAARVIETQIRPALEKAAN